MVEYGGWWSSCCVLTFDVVQLNWKVASVETTLASAFLDCPWFDQARLIQQSVGWSEVSTTLTHPKDGWLLLHTDWWEIVVKKLWYFKVQSACHVRQWTVSFSPCRTLTFVLCLGGPAEERCIGRVSKRSMHLLNR